MDILFDSSVIVASERAQLDLTGIEQRHARDKLWLCSVTVAELLYGVGKRSARHRIQAESFVNQLLSRFPVIPFDTAAAAAHAMLRLSLEKAGMSLGHNDLLIAAIAVANGMAIAARDKDFARLRQITVLHW